MPAKTSNTNLNTLFLIGGIALVVIVAAAYFFNRTPFGLKSETSMLESTQKQTAENPTGKFEFRDRNNAQVSRPTLASVILVNAPGAQEARPITLTARIKDKVVWLRTIKADEPSCADANTCSVGGPDQSEAKEEWYSLEARDNEGNLLARYLLLAVPF